MVGWYHQLSGHELEQIQEMVKDREAWCAAVTKSQTQMSDGTTEATSTHRPLFTTLELSKTYFLIDVTVYNIPVSWVQHYVLSFVYTVACSPPKFSFHPLQYRDSFYPFHPPSYSPLVTTALCFVSMSLGCLVWFGLVCSFILFSFLFFMYYI